MKRVGAIALVLGLVAGAGLARAQVVDGVAAIVDKDVILLSEVEFSAGMVLEQLKEQNEGRPLPDEIVVEVYQEALQSLIDAKLIERFAQRANLIATPAEIDRAVASIAAEESVEPDDIYQAAQAQGLAREAYRTELGKQITRMKVISGSVQSRVSVSEEEMRELYDERYGSQEPGLRVRSRHILIPWAEEDTPEKRERMRKIAATIRAQAIETGDFGALARQYSRAPSAADGGITTFREGEVDPVIGVPVFSLPPGEITEVIETDYGLNIFQIVNRYDPAEVSYGDVEANLRAELVERKTMPEFKEWVKELRGTRYIEVVKPELR